MPHAADSPPTLQRMIHVVRKTLLASQLLCNSVNRVKSTLLPEASLGWAEFENGNFVSQLVFKFARKK